MIDKQVRMTILIQGNAIELRAVHDTKEFDNCKITEFHDIYEIKKELSDSEIDRLFGFVRDIVILWIFATNMIALEEML